MRVLYSWLQDYVDVKLAAPKLAHILTMAGLEVTSLEEISGDCIFDIEVTPNRPDCLNLIGIAREAAALTNKKLKLPKIVSEKDKKSDVHFGLEIVDKKGCSRYSGRVLKGAKVVPSPLWLKKRIELIGMRPINNVVDITNYVMWETGQPLHAFDFDKLADKTIIVRRAKDNEKITTIDALERTLTCDTLVIADSRRPVAIAGIMGGKDTEVTEATKNVLLESAYFDPVSIRRSCRRLGLGSDSSYRFERGIDKLNVLQASMRAANRINELAGSSLVETRDCFVDKAKIKKTKISLSAAAVNGLLGTKIPATKIASILSSLGFKVSKKAKGTLNVEAPSFRADVRRDVDLIEEVSRIYGYDAIPMTLPSIKISDVGEQPIRVMSAAMKDMLLSQGFSEAITYGLVSRTALTKAAYDTTGVVKIVNPLSSEQELLRPTLITGLLASLAHNLHRGIDSVSLFELGTVFQGTQEIITLGIAACGALYNDWFSPLQKKATFFDIKGVVELVLRRLGIQEYALEARDTAFFKKGKSTAILVKGDSIGYLGELKEEVINEWDIKKREIFIAEINVEKLSAGAQRTKRYAPLPVFPSIRRDISLVAESSVSAAQLIETMRHHGGEYLSLITLIEQYRGAQIPKDSRGLVFSLEYQASERTLTDEEVNRFHAAVCEALKKDWSVTIR